MKIKSHRELSTYQQAFAASMTIFQLSRSFPKAETYALTDQIRRSSRSVCANLAEAFRKRKYPKAFISKLIDCEAEAAETQVWLEYCLRCQYISSKDYHSLIDTYEIILKRLFKMASQPEKWTY